MSASVPALPHRWRLWAITIVTLLDLAALAASHLGVGPELLAEARPLVETGLSAVLLVLVPALGDAYMVERRRRTPGIPALPDDVDEPTGRPRAWAPPPVKPRKPGTLIEPSEPYPSAPPDPPVGGAGLALVLVIVAAALSAATSGCSGAAAPFVTVPISVHCSWSTEGATSGGESSELERADGHQERRAQGAAIIDSDCIVEDVRPTTSPHTSGQSTDTGDIAPSLDTSVSAVPGGA